MSTSMKLISILAVLLRWAFRGDDGGGAPEAPDRLPPGHAVLR